MIHPDEGPVKRRYVVNNRLYAARPLGDGYVIRPVPEGHQVCCVFKDKADGRWKTVGDPQTAWGSMRQVLVYALARNRQDV